MCSRSMKNPSAAATWPGRSKDLGPVQEQVVGPRGGRPGPLQKVPSIAMIWWLLLPSGKLTISETDITIENHHF
jgi:hypothetical protein